MPSAESAASPASDGDHGAVGATAQLRRVLDPASPPEDTQSTGAASPPAPPPAGGSTTAVSRGASTESSFEDRKTRRRWGHAATRPRDGTPPDPTPTPPPPPRGAPSAPRSSARREALASGATTLRVGCPGAARAASAAPRGAARGVWAPWRYSASPSSSLRSTAEVSRQSPGRPPPPPTSSATERT